MNPAVESVLCSIVASIICDIGKYGLGQLKYRKVNFEKKDVEKYVFEKIDKKYELLCDSGILLDFLKSPLIIDTVNNYIIYVITGKLEVKLSNNGINKKGKSKYLEESEIIDFLSDNLQKRYIDANVLTIPEKQLIESFFSEMFSLSSNYIFEQVVKNEDKVDDNKGEYISRLITIKKGMENTNTSFLFEKYKEIKISSIELLIDLINENNEKDKNNYLKLVLKSNDRSQRELDSMMNKGFIEVTYLCLKTYINL